MSREGAPAAGNDWKSHRQRVPLQDVITTAKLRRRPSRPPDYEAENRALARVMQAMADASESVLQAIAEEAMELCAAHSAGVSMLEKHDGRSVFRWRAVAGEWSRFRNSTMPREASPCGTVLDQDDSLLVSRPERHYPIPADAQPSIVEALLVPFRVAGVAVGTVWVISHENDRRFDAEDERLATSLGQFASNAYQVLALREAENAANARRTVAEDALRESEATFRSFFANAGVGMAQAEIDTGRLVRVNQRFCHMTGYSADELLGMSFLDITHPEDQEANWAGYQIAIQGASPHYDVEKRYLRKDGRVIWARVNTGVVCDTEGRPVRCSAVVEDITQRKRSEALINAQRTSLEMVARGDALAEVLTHLAQVVEEQSEGRAVASIMLLDEGARLRNGAAPSLPETYLRAIDGIAADADVGTCSAAAATGETVVTTDIAADPNWESLAHLPLEFGLKAAWSSPILCREGRVLGTFGTYFRECRAPSQRERKVVEILSRTAALAIERMRHESALLASEERLRLAVAAGDAGVWDWDLKNDAATVSDSYRHLFGLPPEAPFTYEDWLAAVHPEDRDRCRAYGDAFFASRTATEWNLEFRIVTPHHGIRWHRAIGELSRWPDGTPRRFIGVSSDITELKQNEMARRESEERLRLAAEAAGFGTYDANLQTGEVVWSEEMFRLLGMEPQSVAPFKPYQSADFAHPDDRASLDDAIEQSFDPDGDGRLDHAHRILLRNDEEDVRWVRVVGDTTFAEVDGKRTAVRAVGAVIDITASKRHEEQIRTVMQELNHRVKNMLTVVQSVAQQTVRQAPDLETFADTFNERLRSIGTAHSLLTQSNWERVGLRDIISAESRSGVALPEQCSISGPRVMLPPKAVLAIHMVVHELMTNARKYGGLTTDDGRLNIRWTINDAGHGRTVELEWTEHARHAVREPSAPGYGSRLIAQLIEYELKGSLEREFRPTGLRCRISFPLSGPAFSAPVQGQPLGAKQAL